MDGRRNWDATDDRRDSRGRCAGFHSLRTRRRLCVTVFVLVFSALPPVLGFAQTAGRPDARAVPGDARRAAGRTGARPAADTLPPSAETRRSVWHAETAQASHAPSSASLQKSLLAAPRPLAPPEQSAAAAENPASVGHSIGTTLLSLAVVVTLIFGGARLWKRHAGTTNPRLGNEVIEVLGHAPLDPRHSLQLVRVGQRILMLGVSADRLECLGEITDATEAEVLLGACRTNDKPVAAALPFRALLERRLTGKRPARQRQESEVGESAAALRLMRQLKTGDVRESRHG